MKLSGLIAAVCVLLLSLASASLASQFSGLPVTAIVVQDDEGRPWPHPEHVLPLLTVKPGEVFSSQAVRDGVSYVYLTGRFRDVRVDGFFVSGGVKLIYTLVPTTVVDQLRVRGNHALASSRITDALGAIEGRELREDRFPDYRTTVMTLYQSEGYYDTVLYFRVEKLPEPHHVALFIDIEEPKPTVIAEIVFSGNTVFTGAQLLKVMTSKVGKPLRTDALFDTDLAAILQKYTDAGYPAAKPGPVDISFREGKAYLRVYGTEGPKVSVAFSGNRAFSDRKLRGQVLFWSEHDLSDAIIESSADKIRNLYRDDGYANATVAVKKNESAGALDLTFVVQEGPRITVKDITIRGSSYFPAKQLLGEMSLRESGWFFPTPFREDLLDKDLEYIRDRYGDAGFLEASVKKKVEFVDNGRKAVVAVDIAEGPQTKTGKVTFEGNQAFTEAELLDLLSLKPGAPYNERLVDEDRYRILSAYSNKGFLFVRVDAEKKTVDGAVDVAYRIAEDRQVRIGRIILRGNERTKDSAIMRELLARPGDPYDYGAILASQQRIYHLGYFGLARFEPLHPGEKEYVKDMLLTVEERRAGAVELSIGYGDFDRARAAVEVSYRNLWGDADYASIRAEESDILKRGVFNYRQPWVLGYRVQGAFGLEWSDSKRLNQDTREIYYQTRKTTISYGLEQTHRRLKTSLTYQFENVQNYNVLPQAIVSPEDEGRVRVSSVTPALVWDLRDDIFNPRKGSLHGLAVKEALIALGSEADFTKVTLQSSWYLPVSSGVVSALSARAGMAWPHRTTPDIPLHERFYVGGSTTVRGFTQDSVGPTLPGPDGQPVPQGGASMAVFNAELRMNPSEGFGVVLFGDAGNVWKEQEIHLHDLRASCGAGIRYGTPIGPLRVDYGLKIHRRPGESPGEIHFNIGHTF